MISKGYKVKTIFKSSQIFVSSLKETKPIMDVQKTQCVYMICFECWWLYSGETGSSLAVWLGGNRGNLK